MEQASSELPCDANLLEYFLKRSVRPFGRVALLLAGGGGCVWGAGGGGGRREASFLFSFAARCVLLVKQTGYAWEKTGGATQFY